MGTGNLIGLNSLARGADRRANNKEQMLALEKLNALNQQDQQKELQLQQLEQQQLQMIRASADKLLTPDREKINQKAKEMQRKIKEQVAVYGSRQGLFEAKGLSATTDYTNSILDSQELGVYRQNRTNYEKLMRLMMTPGFMQRITERDKNNLENYQANKGGEITFSGMLNGFDMPDKQYNSDQNKNIIYYKNNRTKLLADYHLEHPDMPIPQTIKAQDKVLSDYLTNLNIGPIKGLKSIGGRETLSGSLLQVFDAVNHGKTEVTLSNISEINKAQSPLLKTVFGGSKNNDHSNGFALRESNNINMPLTTATKLSLGDNVKIKDGVITANIVASGSGATFSQNGTQITKASDVANMIPGKIRTAYRGTVTAGNDAGSQFIATNKVDSDGKFEENVEYGDGSENAKMEMILVQSFINKETGETVYKEIDTQSTTGKAKIIKGFKDSGLNNLISEVQMQGQLAKINNENSRKTEAIKQKGIKDDNDKQASLLPPITKDEQALFDGTIYKMQEDLYKNNSQRNSLQKAFYLTTKNNKKPLKDLIGKGLFKQSMALLNLTQNVRDKNVVNKDIVEAFTYARKTSILNDEKLSDKEKKVASDEIDAFKNKWLLYLYKIDNKL